MRMPCAVAVDLEGGVITLGATWIALRSDGDHFRLPNSARVRAITFGERSAAIALALAEPDSEDSLLPGLRSLALDGSPDPQADAAVLALAGGGEQAPSFAECARQACKKTGLDWKAVEDMPAVAVDRVAAPHQTTANDDGWVRIAFEPRADDAQDLAGIAREMIERLLARGVIAVSGKRQHYRKEPRPGREHRIVPRSMRASAQPRPLTARGRMSACPSSRPTFDSSRRPASDPIAHGRQPDHRLIHLPELPSRNRRAPLPACSLRTRNKHRLPLHRRRWNRPVAVRRR